MKNLVIGNTSQLSFYFPDSYHKISSRNLDLDKIKSVGYKSIYILFAEQRTFLKDSDKIFLDVNFYYTLEIIDQLKDFCEDITLYSTSELWNNIEGPIKITDKYNYNETPYIRSKELLCNHINKNRENYKNIKIVYPFNFNSPYRKDGFLFGKIFKSIIKKEKIEIGNVNFERDLIHPSIIVKESIKRKKDFIIGSGELFNIENFIKDLYEVSNMNFDDYVTYDISNNLPNKRKNYFCSKPFSDYRELIELTKLDLNKVVY